MNEGIGHNSDKAIDAAVEQARAEKPLDNSGGISGAHLRSFIQRIEKLEEEKSAIGDDLKEVYSECKGTGFDTKIVRQIIRLRKIEIEKRRENDRNRTCLWKLESVNGLTKKKDMASLSPTQAARTLLSISAI